MDNKTTFSFQATTKKGITLELFVSTDKDGNIRFGAKNLKNGYEHSDVGHFTKKPEGWCIFLDNEYINENLIGVKAKGNVLIPTYNEQEVNDVKATLMKAYEDSLQAEIDSLTDEDIVTLSWFTTGYGPAASLQHEKLSYKAGKRFEATVKVIKEKKLVEFVNTDPWADYSVTLEAKMPYSKFLELVKKAEELKVEQERKRQEKEIKEQQDRKEIEENELFLWNAGVIYSSAGNRMLHSLGAQFAEDKISIYTTSYSRDIPSANTTFTIKDTLKADGFTYNEEKKNWEIPYSEENAQKVIALLKKYDSKAWPSESGMVRCWECGSYFKYRKGCEDGPGYYCGC